MRLWKQAVRQLFRAPGFLSVAALALALGIGSTTTIFSIVRAVFLRGLPYADPESLVQLRSSVPEQQIVGAGFSYPRSRPSAIGRRSSAPFPTRRSPPSRSP